LINHFAQESRDKFPGRAAICFVGKLDVSTNTL
jgi:hypothetical protein